MGQAKRRGTFEERKQQAINKKAAFLLEIKRIREALIENKDNIQPVLANPKNKREMVLAIAAALSTTGHKFHVS